MRISKFFWLSSLSASLLLVGATAQAALTVYTNAAAFAAATSAPGVDSFASLSQVFTASPLSRNAGVYAYNTSVPSGFFPGGTVADPFLSTNTATETVTFNGFNAVVKGFAGNFFASDINGLFAAGTVSLTALDSLGGTSTQTVTASGILTGSFLGFVTNGNLTSVTLTAVQPLVGVIWPSVDNLTLAAAVPEPGSYALMLLGLGAVGLARRRIQGPH